METLEACRLRAGLNNYDFFCVCLIPAVYNLLIPQTKLEQEARGLGGWGLGEGFGVNFMNNTGVARFQVFKLYQSNVHL